MTTNHIDIDVPPRAVFAVLMDAYAYPEWVVGTKRVRGTDPDWPAVGARFHHAVGVPGVELKDSSKLLEIEDDRKVLLEVRFRPAGVAIVRIELEPGAGGQRTHVTMNEVPKSGPARTWWSKPLELLIVGRNAWSLRRLAHLCEHRAHDDDTDASTKTSTSERGIGETEHPGTIANKPGEQS